MFNLKIALPAVLLLGGFMICSTATYGKTEYTKATKKQCVFCHAKTSANKEEMNKNLTDAGKYYHEKKTLDGYEKK